jgi:hypothetical protein
MIPAVPFLCGRLKPQMVITLLAAADINQSGLEK